MTSSRDKLTGFICQAYPIWIVLMFIYEQVIIAFLNFPVFSIYEILIALSWLPILITPFLLTNRRVLYYLVVLAVFIDGLFLLFHITTTNELPITYSLIALSETNPNESFEFLRVTSNVFQLLIIPFLLIFFLAVKKVPSGIVEVNYKFLNLSILISILVLSGIYLRTHLKKMILPYNARIMLEFKAHSDLYKLFDERRVLDVPATIAKNERTQNIFVLIMGESCNRNHLSLYGYKKKTTPRLDERDDLFVFSDVVSPYAVTVPAVLTTLTEANIDNGLQYQKSVNLIDLFHSVNHSTYWLSNHEPRGIWNNAITKLSDLADSTMFYDDKSKINYINTSRYDGILLNPLKGILTIDQSDKFILLHLMGNHMEYKKRYPQNFNYFKSSASTEEQVVSEYDNSVLYNDFIIDSIFNILKEYSIKNPNAVISSVYLADHGENVYDEKGKLGHDYTPPYTKSEVEIPFLVWLSDSFKNVHSHKVDEIMMNINRPFMSDDLFYSVLDLNGITFSGSDSTRSIFNSKFNYSRKRILGDKQNYDLMNTK